MEKGGAGKGGEQRQQRRFDKTIRERAHQSILYHHHSRPAGRYPKADEVTIAQCRVADALVVLSCFGARIVRAQNKMILRGINARLMFPSVYYNQELTSYRQRYILVSGLVISRLHRFLVSVACQMAFCFVWSFLRSLRCSGLAVSCLSALLARRSVWRSPFLRWHTQFLAFVVLSCVFAVMPTLPGSCLFAKLWHVNEPSVERNHRIGDKVL